MDFTQEELKELFDYRDGWLYWKIKRGKIRVGDRAGGICDNRVLITYYRKKYKAHRLIFLHRHGYLPEYIDHINRDSLDNRIENLRPCTKAQNSMNGRVKRGSTSRFTGVSAAHHNKTNPWIAGIKLNQKRTNLGYFATEEAAARAYDAAAKEMFGEFASLNFG